MNVVLHVLEYYEMNFILDWGIYSHNMYDGQIHFFSKLNLEWCIFFLHIMVFDKMIGAFEKKKAVKNLNCYDETSIFMIKALIFQIPPDQFRFN